jgi:hypothetical protein
MSATLKGTRQLAPAEAGRWSLRLIRNNGKCGTQPGFTEPTLALVPRAKYRHGSARGLAGLTSLPPLHSAALQLRKLRFRSTAFRSRQICRDRIKPAAPKWGQSGTITGGAATLVAALLARLEPSLRFRFSLIALGRCGAKQAARLRPAGKAIARDASHGPVGAGTACQYRREALPIAEARGNSTARLRPVQATRNKRGDGPAFTHSAARRKRLASGRRVQAQGRPTPVWLARAPAPDPHSKKRSAPS